MTQSVSNAPVVALHNQTPNHGHIAEHAEQVLRNPGLAFDADCFAGMQVNRSATERRAASYGHRRSIKKQQQAAWLLKAITLIDLTTLSGDDTAARVRRLCAKAKQPLSAKLREQLNMGDWQVSTAAVCVYHDMLETASAALDGSGVHLAAVSTGFPAGLSPLPLRLQEIGCSVADGADEIDIVISRRQVLEGNWRGLYDEIKAMRQACGEAHIKTILATGELGNLTNVAKASMVCMMAGADFIKTSTGKESVNATLPVSLTMVRAIRDYLHMTGYQVGFKPAGGVSDAKTALLYMTMMKEELGERWLQPDLFRFGASSLLGDIERQLDHYASGYYSAAYRHSMG
ncbi:MAG TPA: deoxyribose-phosphate aldolase [Oceanospirillaceae bacterium]|nr:deoxyribose-phosphate aldolase [Oceanospirillaceae bacterium]